MTAKKKFPLFLIAFVLLAFAWTGQVSSQGFPSPPNTTKWDVKTSLRFDALAFLGILTGEDHYVSQYPEIYERFKPLVPDYTQTAIDELNFRINTQAGLPFPAWVILYFSVMEGDTIADLTKNLDDIDAFKARFERTQFFSQSSWQLFMKIQDDLVMYFRFLEKIDFEGYWRAEILPKLEERARAARRGIQGFDVIGEVEYVTGRLFPDRSLDVYITYFNRPKGIRLADQSLVVNNQWSIDRIVGVAVHELLHPPLEVEDWRAFVFEADYLKKDKYFMDAVTGHDRALGYNSYQSFINENVTLFLDQKVSEKMGVGIEVKNRWGTVRGVDYVFAKALYVLAERYNFPENGESATSFLTRVATNGDLEIGQVEILNKVFMGEEEDPALKAIRLEEERLERIEYEKTLPPICDFKQNIIRNCRVVKKKKSN